MKNNPDELSLNIRNKLKELRLRLFPQHGGMKKCAEMIGVSAQLWRDWESGHTRPSIQNQQRIADFFGITVGELRGEAKESAQGSEEIVQLKQQVSGLEERIQTLEGENNVLREENSRLNGMVSAFREMLNNPKTVSDAPVMQRRITRIKIPKGET